MDDVLERLSSAEQRARTKTRHRLLYTRRWREVVDSIRRQNIIDCPLMHSKENETGAGFNTVTITPCTKETKFVPRRFINNYITLMKCKTSRTYCFRLWFSLLALRQVTSQPFFSHFSGKSLLMISIDISMMIIRLMLCFCIVSLFMGTKRLLPHRRKKSGRQPKGGKVLIR